MPPLPAENAHYVEAPRYPLLLGSPSVVTAVDGSKCMARATIAVKASRFRFFKQVLLKIQTQLAPWQLAVLHHTVQVVVLYCTVYSTCYAGCRLVKIMTLHTLRALEHCSDKFNHCGGGGGREN